MRNEGASGVLVKIILFEWRYQSKQISFIAAIAIFFLLGLLIGGQPPGEPNLLINGPQAIAHALALLSLGAIFVVTMFCANALLRDSEHRMNDIIFTTSVTKHQFLFGRFVGSFTAAVLVFSVSILAMAFSRFLPWVPVERVGPANPVFYLWPLFFIVIPNIFLFGSLLFSIAALTRNALATYVGGVAIYVLYFTASGLMNSPVMAGSAPATQEGLAFAALADPIGMAAIIEQTRYWTNAERNGQLLGLSGHFLANRLLWVGIGVVLLTGLGRFFSFRAPNAKPKKEKPVPRESPPPISDRAPDLCHSGRAQWHAFRSSVKLEIGAIIRGLPFIGFLILWLFMIAMELVSAIHNGNFGSPSYPTTALMFSRFEQTTNLFGLLLVVYYSAELVWRDRELKMSELVDAAPTGGLVPFGAKLAALTFLIGTLIATGVATALIFQFSRGYGHIQPNVYLALFYVHGLPLVLIAVLALLTQTLTPNKYLGMPALVLLVLTMHRGLFTGANHFMLRYAGAPPVIFSDMNGFGHFLEPFSWFMLYWLCGAGFLVCLTLGLWRRGADTRLAVRLRSLPVRLGSRGKLGAGLCLAAMLLCGGWIFYNTHIRNTYETSDQRLDKKADYEKIYGAYADRPQPKITDLAITLDLFPEQRRLRVRGRLELINTSDQAMHDLLLNVRDNLTVDELSITGAALESFDKRFNTYLIHFEQALLPGKSARCEWDFVLANPGFVNDDPDLSISANGSFLLAPRLMPSFGYREGLALKDPIERRKRGLHALDGESADGDEHLDQHSDKDVHWLNFEATISTTADQIAVAPGDLVKRWRENDRHFFHYVSPRPVTPFLAVVSARYEVRREQHGAVAIEVYHHPGHGYNIDRMIKAAKDSLDYCEAQFGAYSLSHLKVVEIPDYWSFFSGIGLPGMIGFQESRSFLADTRNPRDMDLVTRRIAHEVAHQWWGHQLSVSTGPGASLLVESLAKYTEMMVLERTYGRDYLKPLMRYEMDRYLRGRANERDRETPLLSEDRAYLAYSKGMIAMLAIQDLIGEAAFNQALRRLLAEHGPGQTPAVADDLLMALFAVASAENRVVIEKWLKRILLYDLKVTDAQYRVLADGRYETTLELSTRVNESDGVREEPSVFDENIEIGLFSKHPGHGGDGQEVLYLARHHFTGASTRLMILTDRPPAFVGVDPNLYFIEKNRFDNFKKVEQQP